MLYFLGTNGWNIALYGVNGGGIAFYWLNFWNNLSYEAQYLNVVDY